MYFKILTFLSLFVVATYAQNEDTLTINGTGDSQELLRGLASIYKAETGNEVIIPNSIGSGGGINRVIKGESKIARVARGLKEKEKAYGLSYKLFAYSPVVFVVNTEITKPINLNTNDILNIYNSKITKWEDLKNTNLNGKIYVINREDGDSSRSVLDKNIKDFKNIIKPTGITAFYNGEAIKFLTKNKNTIGYLSISNTIGTKLKIISLNNIYPSIENIKNKSYKLTTPFGFVFKGELNSKTKEFFKFLQSPKAQNYMILNGIISVI